MSNDPRICRLFLLGLISAAALATSSAYGQGSKYGQYAPEDAYEDGSELAYYGSENEWTLRQFYQEKADRAYKRRGQRQILQILDGDAEKGLRLATARLEEDPRDLESMFTRTVAYCQLGKLDEAYASMQEAVDAGLPVERFLAGPRNLLEPLTAQERFQQFAAERTSGLLHGPMLGAATPEGVQVWLRTAAASPVVVRIFELVEGSPKLAAIQSVSGATREEDDYTTTIQITGLQPDTSYAYDVLIDGRPVLPSRQRTFTTLPEPGQPIAKKFAFGGGAGFTPQYERMWDTIAAVQPDGLLLLGDNVYIDLPQKPRGFHKYTYYRRQSRPEFRGLIDSTLVYAIWDDHDCGTDDVWMGPYVDRPAWKPDMLRIFRQNWVNPGYGSEEAPGCWFATTMGDVDFFFLDCRYYRTNPFGDHPTMLGPTQKAWLLDQLAQSTARIKLVVSSVPWAKNVKPGSRDTWDGYAEEREEIFQHLEQEKIEGVVLLSADRHRSDLRRIERPDCYPLYDMMSSRLTNLHFHECIDGALFCYNEKCSFGLLSIDTTQKDAVVNYKVVNIDGETVHNFDLRESELRFR